MLCPSAVCASPLLHSIHPQPQPPTAAVDLAGVSEYIAALKAMGAANPAGVDDATLATLLEGETPEDVSSRWCCVLFVLGWVWVVKG